MLSTVMAQHATRASLKIRAARLIRPLAELEARMLTLERAHAKDIANADRMYRRSARNLIHYLAMRQIELRPMQPLLAELGLSSLGRGEAHALASLRSVLTALRVLADEPEPRTPAEAPPTTLATGAGLLQKHAARLLGPRNGERRAHIMVTMPSEAASDPHLVRELLQAGMSVMRINCAHDAADDWEAMIQHLREAERETGLCCKVYADLAGPKLRTTAIAPTPAVRKIRPKRDAHGRVLAPARLRFCFADVCGGLAPGDVCVSGAGFVQARITDQLRLVDASGRTRKLEIVDRDATGATVVISKTVYLTNGCTLRLRRGKKTLAKGLVCGLPDSAEPIVVRSGDVLLLTRAETPGGPATYDAAGAVLRPAQIGCTLPELLSAAQPGQRIFFDDGKIRGEVTRVEAGGVVVTITQAGRNGSRLASEKGINVPDTTLNIAALTDKDLEDLAFMARRADIVGMSFVRAPRDVEALFEQLDALEAPGLGVVLKIETQQAFSNLPQLLLRALARPPVGVMIARGDLAIEVGFERMAEVQEQILWLCEAAHVPVIWATQVLDDMARYGSPTRAEVSDAVMSGRAECVMLNKGPYMPETVRFLSGILARMSAHQSKKRALLRPLSVSRLP